MRAEYLLYSHCKMCGTNFGFCCYDINRNNEEIMSKLPNYPLKKVLYQPDKCLAAIYLRKQLIK